MTTRTRYALLFTLPPLFVAGHVKAWAASFADDGSILPPNAAMVTGTTALEAWARGFSPLESMTWPDVQVHGDGNGKRIAVHHRGVDGHWKVAGKKK